MAGGLSFFLFRFSAMPGLFAGHLLTCLAFYGSVSDNWPLYLATSFKVLIRYTSLPGSYSLRRRPIKKAKGLSRCTLDFDSFSDCICHLFNGLLLEIANSVYFNPPNWIEVKQYMVGDMIGALLCIAGFCYFSAGNALGLTQSAQRTSNLVVLPHIVE